MRAFKLGFTILASSLLFACATTPDNPAEKYHDLSEKKLYQSALNDIKHRSYKSATEKFEGLDARYPFGEYADKGQLYIIYTYYKSDNIAEALAAAERYIHLHPDSAHIDYVYFIKGVLNYRQQQGVFEKYFPSDLSQRDLDPARQSYITFSRLVASYPQSQYRNAAIEYMTYLRNLMASHELKVAKFYYSRKAYVAALNRVNQVISRYQGAPVMPEALQLAIDSYQALKLPKLAEMYQKVLEYNFPATS